ncbi:TPT-domain-containing protein [Hortaea werneckii]|nr:TPT-domain-containing protein [Hortaea werneckii]KAI7305508.1 TPT-domain-containing protein [Hortaea werneckii]
MAGTHSQSQSEHRRRSGSLIQAAGSQNRSKENSRDRIAEESDMGPSNSDVEGTRSDDDREDDEETGLTHTERKQRRQRLEKNTTLDERVVGGGDNTHPRRDPEQMASASLVRTTVINAAFIAFWYCCSISISVYNKWMFSKDNLDFHFPLFTTSIHMLVQFGLSAAVLFFFPRFRPQRPRHEGYQQLDGTDTETIKPEEERKPLMTRWFYFTRIGPCGTATALDIGLGNFSLRFITLTFYTMCKSSVLAFVLGFAFIFRLEKPTLKLCAIITVMTAGVIMMVAGETAFSALGFVLVMCASACSGFRWSLTQILLLRNPSTSNPFSSIFFLTPVMFVALFVLAVPIEGPAPLIDGFRTLGAEKGAILGTLIILFPGCLAFAMVAAEFALLQRTSVVTLSVCGIFKEVLTISAAGIVFGDELSPINVSGLVVTILSIAAYNYLKYSKMHKQANTDAHHGLGESAEGVPLRRSGDRQRDGHNNGGELATHPPRSSREGLLDDEDRSSHASFDEDDDGGGRAWADGPFSPAPDPSPKQAEPRPARVA